MDQDDYSDQDDDLVNQPSDLENLIQDIFESNPRNGNTHLLNRFFELNNRFTSPSRGPSLTTFLGSQTGSQISQGLRSIVSGIFEFSNYYQNANIINNLSESIDFPTLQLSRNVSRYSEEDYDVATNYFFMLRDEFLLNNDIDIQRLYSTDISQNYFTSENIKLILLNYYYGNRRDPHFPDYQTFISEIYRYRCPCCQHFTERQVKRVIELYTFIYGDLLKCDETPFYMEYYILHGRIPNEDEFLEFYRRSQAFNRSPEDFYQTDKIKVPALNVDKLPTYIYTKREEEGVCGICQYDFEEGKQIIKLKPCGHEFHNTKEDCLEEGSILTWLENNNFCPLCKTKVDADVD